MGNGHEKQADSEGGKTKMNRIEDVTNYITECDKEVGEALSLELGRQRRNLELIASENIVSPAVMLAMGTVPTNKYAEGYPGKRYYGGCEDVDILEQEERGFIKVVADEATGKILGAQMMCARATDMIGKFVTAITNGLTVEQMLRGMRSHPTYNEGIGEALEELEGGAVHVVPRKKK